MCSRKDQLRCVFFLQRNQETKRNGRKADAFKSFLLSLLSPHFGLGRFQRRGIIALHGDIPCLLRRFSLLIIISYLFLKWKHIRCKPIFSYKPYKFQSRFGDKSVREIVRWGIYKSVIRYDNPDEEKEKQKRKKAVH